MRKPLAALIIAALTGLTAQVAAARPLRVMSINDCSDQLVLTLLPPAQITSVTWLARDPSISIMTAAAMKVPTNHGLAEEVMRDRPDLVIAGAFATPSTRALLKKLHFRVLEVGSMDSFDDVRRQTRLVATAVGEPARGEALLVRMEADLRQLADHPGPPLRVVAWDGAGFAAQPGTMYDAILHVAGARNLSAEGKGLTQGAPSIEQLLAARPDMLVEGAPGDEHPGLRSAVLDNPTVHRIWGERTVVLPAQAYVCGTPFSAAAAVKLRDDLRAAAAHARRPLPFAATP